MLRNNSYHPPTGTHRLILKTALLLGVMGLVGQRQAEAALPPGNTVEQWNQIAETTVVASGAFQNESLVYMGYVETAVYNSAVAIGGGYAPLGAGVVAPKHASLDAAVIEAAYDTLVNYFPAQTASLNAWYTEALAQLPDGIAKSNGQGVGLAAATALIQSRIGDGRRTPYAVSSTFPTRPPEPGVWRLTPPGYLAPQTPWVGDVRPFILDSADHFLPGPPPALTSLIWVKAFDEIQGIGSSISVTRTADQTATAKFWSANVVRQYNHLVRDLIDARGLGLVQSARLAAMVNVIAADAQISVMHAKYHYLFWRPVTAIDPSSVSATDPFGPFPGFDDGIATTMELAGWRPLLITPNHPEYPAAHGSLTSAMAEVLIAFLDSDRINVDIHGFDAAGAAGNLDAVHHFSRPSDLRSEIVNARLWAGLHYRFSTEAGVALGRQVAQYDLQHAFKEIDD